MAIYYRIKKCLTNGIFKAIITSVQLKKEKQMITKTTKTIKPADADIKWYLIDADGVILGRLASQIATILRGKNKPCFSPNQDCGDHVIVINAEKIAVTGRKLAQKEYYRHTGYIGGLKTVTLPEQLKNHPERVLIQAVKTMLTRNSLGAKQMKKLHVFAGAEHPHAAQQPITLDIAGKNPKNKRGA